MFELGGQLLQHVFFETAQQEGSDAFTQPGHGSLVAILGDGDFVPVAEIIGAAQVAGHEEVEEAPEIEDRVFQRGAGQHQPVFRSDGLHGLGVLRAAVFDVLGLVEHRRVEGVSPVLLDVASQQRVAGDHQIVSGDLRKELVALRPGQHQHPKLWGKARGLSGPVGDQ